MTRLPSPWSHHPDQGRKNAQGRSSREVAEGIVKATELLLRGQVQGFSCVDVSQRLFWISQLCIMILPGMALVVVLAIPEVRSHAMVTRLVASLCASLIPPVVTHFGARRWKRDPAWLRYAIAFNWCKWAVQIRCVVIAVVAIVACRLLHMPVHNVVVLLMVAMVGVWFYMLWLQWFLAQAGLGIRASQAVFLVAATEISMLVVAALSNLMATLQ